MTKLQLIELKHKEKRRHKFVVWIIASLLIMLSLSTYATPKTAGDLDTYVTVTVSTGDTLWEIADHVNQLYYENQLNLNDLVEHLKSVNHLRSVVIQEGQELKVSTNIVLK